MITLRSTLIWILFLLCNCAVVFAQERRNDLDRNAGTEVRTSVKVGVNFGNQRGGGVVLSPDGLIVTCKHVVQGFSDGRIELNDREQHAFKILREVKDKDLVFLLAEKPISVPFLKFRSNESLVEGEPLTCRAMIGGSIMCTIKGSLACSPEQSAASVLLAQMPLSPGSSGSPIFDSRGQFVGIVLGPLSEEITDFARGWSANVVRDAMISEFGNGVDQILASKWTTNSLSKKIEVVVPSNDLLLQGDVVLKVGELEVSSYYDLVCLVTPHLERKTQGFEVSVFRKGQVVRVFIKLG